MRFPIRHELPLMLLLCLCVSGCMAMLFEAPKVKSDAYKLAAPPAPWHEINAGTSDIAYQYPGDRAMISVNSICEQYQDLSLEELAKGVALGLRDQRVVTAEPLTVDGIPSLRTTFAGTLQSVPMLVSLTVVRSKLCVYDLLLVARAESFPSHKQTAEQFVQGFHERAAP